MEGLLEPQGVGYSPKADLVFLSNARDGSVRLFKGADLAPAETINLSDGAENIRSDGGALAGLPYFNPNSFRNTLAHSGERLRKTAEQSKVSPANAAAPRWLHNEQLPTNVQVR
jgi:hypothetical protein